MAFIFPSGASVGTVITNTGSNADYKYDGEKWIPLLYDDTKHFSALTASYAKNSEVAPVAGNILSSSLVLSASLVVSSSYAITSSVTFTQGPNSVSSSNAQTASFVVNNKQMRRLANATAVSAYVWTLISFPSIDVDTIDGITYTDPGTFYIDRAGKYNFNLQCATNVNGNLFGTTQWVENIITFTKNGWNPTNTAVQKFGMVADRRYSGANIPSLGTYVILQNTDWTFDCVVGDTIRAGVYMGITNPQSQGYGWQAFGLNAGESTRIIVTELK